MKKLLLLFPLFVWGFKVMATDKIVANFETVLPKSESVDVPLILTSNFNNPAPGGINTSSKVVKIEKPANLGALDLGYKVIFDSLKLQLNPILKVKYYSDTNVLIQPYLITSNGIEQEIPYTRSDGILAGQAKTWIEYVLDLSKYLKTQRYQGIKFYIGKNDNKPVVLYIDDIRFSKLSNPDSIIVTAETFGIADCRQLNAGGLNPPLKYPSDTFTVRHASNDVAGFRGNDTWYAKTAYDSLPAGRYVFTAQNGRWADLYSLWASSVLHQNATFVNPYPNPTVPQTTNAGKQSNSVLLAPTGRHNFGWDSLVIENIDITGCKNFKIGFGLLYRNDWNGTRNFYLRYKIDQDAVWRIIDPANYKNFNPAGNTERWMWVTVDLPKDIKGKFMSIVIHCDVTNTNIRFLFDDLVLSSDFVKADSIHIVSDKNEVTINKTLSLSAIVYPIDVYDNSVTWSVINGTGTAIIDSVSGLLKGTSIGTVQVVATANDGSGISGSKEIIIGPTTSKINIYSVNGKDSINTGAGTLQLSYTAEPDNAPDTTVTWSIKKIDGNATINQNGLVRAIADGIVYAVAKANDGGGAIDSFKIVITNQIKPNEIILAGPDEITENDGIITLTATVLPDSASNKEVIWSVSNTSLAIIDQDGRLKAIRNGTVIVRATALADPNVFAEKNIVLSNQIVELASIKLKTAGNATSISTNKGTLQCSVELTPADAAYSNIRWSVDNALRGSITSNGLFTARSNGTVKIIVEVDNFKDSVSIVLTNQIVLVEQITVASATGKDSITIPRGSLKLVATVLPADASDMSVTWSSSDENIATVNTFGYVFAKANGSVVITVRTNDGSNLTDQITIHIINQPTSGTDVISPITHNFNIYPNPADNYIRISNYQVVEVLNIISIDGKVISSLTNLKSDLLPISHLNSGIYYINILTQDKQVFRTKFLKK